MTWIPVTERLPNKQDDYLVTIPLDNNSTYVDVLHFHKGKFYETDSEWGDVVYDDVTAWMLLPEPYKADRKTENSSEIPNNCEKTDCDTCRYAGECDWEPWQECPYEPKDEPTISKMEQVDKDINVRSKESE